MVSMVTWTPDAEVGVFFQVEVDFSFHCSFIGQFEGYRANGARENASELEARLLEPKHKLSKHFSSDEIESLKGDLPSRCRC